MRILSRYERLDGRIKVSNPDRNIGTSRMLNATLSLATGEFVGVLGDGDELAQDALFEMVRALQDHAESDVIYSDEDDRRGREQDSAPLQTGLGAGSSSVLPLHLPPDRLPAKPP